MQVMNMKENTPVQEKNSVLAIMKILKCKKESITIILSLFSAILSVVALVTDIYPQTIYGNVNHLEMANAGNVSSQMFLADYYCEIGEYEEAIYWYRIASVSNDDYKYFDEINAMLE